MAERLSMHCHTSERRGGIRSSSGGGGQKRVSMTCCDAEWSELGEGNGGAVAVLEGADTSGKEWWLSDGDMVACPS